MLRSAADTRLRARAEHRVIVATFRDPPERLWPWIAEPGKRRELLDWFRSAHKAHWSGPADVERLRHLTGNDIYGPFRSRSHVGPVDYETGHWCYGGDSRRGFVRWWTKWGERAIAIRATVVAAGRNRNLRATKGYLEAIEDLESLLTDVRYGFRRSENNDLAWPLQLDDNLAPNLATTLALALSEELVGARRAFRCLRCGDWGIEVRGQRGPRRKFCSPECQRDAGQRRKNAWAREHPKSSTARVKAWREAQKKLVADKLLTKQAMPTPR